MKKLYLVLFLIFLVIISFIYYSLSKYPSIDNQANIILNNQRSPESNSPINLEIPTLTIDSIFSDKHLLNNNLPKSELITIIATGDIIPARTVNYQTIQKGDFTWAFRNVYDILKNADLTFINLESALISQCPIYRSGFTFCGDAKHIEGMKLAGIDIVNLANNHAGNFQLQGLKETEKLLMDNDMNIVGTGDPVIKEIKGVKFAFIGYNDVTTPQPGINNVSEENIIKDIIKAKKQADFVIVAFHWGAEYRSQPDERQKYLAHFTIDQGADLIIGNHPHWIQPIEIYKDKLITYAHGNFIFDQEWSQKTKEGVVGKYTFYKNKLIDVEYYPLEIIDYGQPYFLTGSYRDKILSEMYQESLVLKK